MLFCSTQLAGSVVEVGLKDLLGFFQRHETGNPKLGMICPWNGIFLPSIDIMPGTSNVFNGRFELSIQWSVALMQYADNTGANTDKIAN